MACTTVQMLQDAILGWARPRMMSRMYGSAAAAVSALPRTVTAIVTVLAFTAPPSWCCRHGQRAAAPGGERRPGVAGRGDGPARIVLGAGDQLLRGDAAHPVQFAEGPAAGVLHHRHLQPPPPGVEPPLPREPPVEHPVHRGSGPRPLPATGARGPPPPEGSCQASQVASSWSRSPVRIARQGKLGGAG